MGMVVRTNVMANNAFRQLGMNNSAVSKSLEKLSSGFRINRAGDDAAGLAISERMKAQIKGLDAASANSQDGISLVQTAEGALNEVHDMLNRMVELATKSANGVYTEGQRKNYSDELDELKSEINRIADSTNFNSLNLLDGSMSTGGKTDAPTSSAPVLNTEDASITNAEKVTGTISWGGSVTDEQKNAFNEALKTGEGITVTGTTGGKYKVDSSTLGDYELYYTDNGVEKKVDPANEITGGLIVKDKSGNTIANINVTVANTDSGTIKVNGGVKYRELDTTNKANFEVDLAGKDLAAGQGKKVTLTIGDLKIETDAFATATAGDKEVAQALLKKLAVGGDVNKAEAEINGVKYDVTIKDGTKLQFVAKTAGELGDKAVTTDSKPVLSGEGGATLGGAADSNITITVAADGTDSNTSTGPVKLQVGDTNDSYNQLILEIGNMHTDKLGTASKSGQSINDISILSQAKAGEAIDVINAAIDQVSSERSNLGAVQNRLEHTINNLDTTSENLSAANSRIRDTDMAKEMMNYTKMNVLVQSAQAMLAQANQQPQSVLQLLQ